jgi:flagellar biosynthesis protein FlhF
MNVKRFTGRTSREAMQKVREAFGDDGVVLSNKPAAEGGVEIMAMASGSVEALDNMPAARHEPAMASEAQTLSQRLKASRDGAQQQSPASGSGASGSFATSVQDDVKQLAMSTLSFQDYVRERMLKRRQAVIKARTEPELAISPEEQLTQRVMHKPAAPAAPARPVARPAAPVPTLDETLSDLSATGLLMSEGQGFSHHDEPVAAPAMAPDVGINKDPKVLTFSAVAPRRQAPAATPSMRHEPDDSPRYQDKSHDGVMGELRAMRELMNERFQTMAFIDQVQRTPGQAQMAQQLLDSGFSPALVRKMIDGLSTRVPEEGLDELAWSAQVLQRNLNTADHEPNLEDQPGVYALIGATGVGKTTCAAKLAALFAAKHGAHNLGLITLDAYRLGAHEQLRAYGRILGVPVHIAHDRAALEDLLELLSNKQFILIDTAGMPQRDTRTRELLEMLSQERIRKLLVINAANQGDCIEDVMLAYKAAECAGIVLSKLDEAVKLGPALDALIRHKLKLMGVTNGQRVPEDWHRLSGASLIQRAMRANINPAYRYEPNDLSLIFSSADAAGRMSTSV